MTVKYGQSLGYVNQIRMKCSPTVKSLVINVMNKSDKLYCLKAILLNYIYYINEQMKISTLFIRGIFGKQDYYKLIRILLELLRNLFTYFH
jgi:hypothetical protein